MYAFVIRISPPPNVAFGMVEDTLYKATFGTYSNVFNISPGEPWTLGGCGLSNGTVVWPSNNFVVHEVRMYNTALSDNDVAAVRADMKAQWA